MVELTYHGGLGNTLFQHAFARLLADRLGWELNVRPTFYVEHNTGTHRQRDALGITGFPKTGTPLNGESHAGPLRFIPEGNSYTRQNSQTEALIDTETLVAQCEPCRLACVGYFQKYAYLRPHKQALRQLFQTDIPLKNKPGPKDVVLYLQTYFNVRADFYASQLEGLHYDNLFAVVNDLKRAQPMLDSLEKFHPQVVHHTDYLTDFEFLRQAQRIIMAPSSFAWWASWLSDAESITVAEPSEGYGSAIDGVAEIKIDDEGRYRYLPYAADEKPPKMKKLISKLFGKNGPAGRQWKYGEKVPLREQLEKVFAPYSGDMPYTTFIETGTYEGETVASVCDLFSVCHTIELDPGLAEQAQERHAGKSIHFHQGNTSEILPRLAQNAEGPTVFYLDAHYSGDGTAQGPEDVPLLREMKALAQRDEADLIIIDDASLFGESPSEWCGEDWSLITPDSLLAPFDPAKVEHIFQHDRLFIWPQGRLAS